MTSLEQVLERVEQAAAKGGRRGEDIKIVPVSKKHSVETILSSLKTPAFPRVLGENYYAELEEKSKRIPSIEWHFLGALQSRQIKSIVRKVDFIHGLCRKKEVQKLLSLKNEGLSIPRFFIQVNLSEELQKNGLASEELPLFIDEVSRLALKDSLCGLMTMPSEGSGEYGARKVFSALRELRDSLLPSGELSMGMSQDFEWAIQEGATVIRLGSILFGERPQP